MLHSVVILTRERLLPAGLELTAMTRSNDALEDLHFRSRSPLWTDGADLTNGHRTYRPTRWRQLLCAWFIVLTVAALFKITDLISANRTAPFAHMSDLAQTADAEQVGEIERWERGVPRQWTMTMPSQRNIVLLSRADQ